MSAYGALARPARPSPLSLPTTAWPHPRDPNTTLTHFHLDSSAIVDAPGLFDHLHAVFADEVDKGLTYPQEDMRDPNAFRAYFLAADVVIALRVLGSERASDCVSEPEWERCVVPREVKVDLEDVRAGRPWDECVVGFYYVGARPFAPPASSGWLGFLDACSSWCRLSQPLLATV